MENEDIKHIKNSEKQAEKEVKVPSKQVKAKDNTPPHRRGRSGDPRGGDEGSEFIEKVLSIKRVTKVTKGGKKLSFSALVVVGDAKGNVGYSLSKAGEVAIAIRKAIGTAKKNMIRIHLKGTTIPHEIIGVCGGAEVLLKPASDGTGVIASGPVRAVCDGVGIHNILTKCHRSNNPINVVKATLNGLTSLKSKKE
jgi:small subunit ribosomal protein S5